MRGQFHDIRWLPAKNVGSVEIPPFGLVEVSGVEHELPNLMVLEVKRPTEDTPAVIGINGMKPIAAGDYGLATVDSSGPLYVLKDTGTAAFGESWGAQQDSFLAKQGNAGLICYGSTTLGAAKTAPLIAVAFPGASNLKPLCRFTLDAALATSEASEGATITDQYGPGADHSETDITVYNMLTSTTDVYLFEGAIGAAGLAMWDSGTGWKILQMECP